MMYLKKLNFKNKILKNKKKILVIAIVLFCITSTKIGFSYFFATGNFTGNSLINIPGFAPKVNNSNDMNQTISLSSTINNGKSLAPGATGKFKIDVDFSGVGSNAYYNISFDRTNIPNNIHFYVDSELTKELANIDGVQYKGYDNKLAEHYIYWAWVYDNTPESNANDNLYMNSEIILPFTAHIAQRVEGHTIIVNEIEKPTGRVNLTGLSGNFHLDIDFSNIAAAKNFKIYFDKENNKNKLHLYSDEECENEITSIDAIYDGTNNEISKTIYWKLDGEEINNLSLYYVIY